MGNRDFKKYPANGKKENKSKKVLKFQSPVKQQGKENIIWFMKLFKCNRKRSVKFNSNFTLALFLLICCKDLFPI